MWSELPEDVRTELEDERYAGRTHYRKATSAAGCRGPLCRKAERDEARRRTEEAARQAGRTYKPAAPGAARERDAELDLIITWHERERGIIHDREHCATCACSERVTA